LFVYAEDTRMSKRRIMFRFSLSTLLVIVTALCVWIALGTQRARTQKRAVEEMKRQGASVLYDFQVENFGFGSPPPPFPENASPLTKLLGVDFFRGIDTVYFGDSAMDIGDAPAALRPLQSSEIDQLKSLATVKNVTVYRRVGADDLRALAELDGLKSLVIGEYTGDEDSLARVQEQHPNLQISIAFRRRQG
jgi:hypothetical protein